MENTTNHISSTIKVEIDRIKETNVFKSCICILSSSEICATCASKINSLLEMPHSDIQAQQIQRLQEYLTSIEHLLSFVKKKHIDDYLDDTQFFLAKALLSDSKKIFECCSQLTLILVFGVDDGRSNRIDTLLNELATTLGDFSTSHSYMTSGSSDKIPSSQKEYASLANDNTITFKDFLIRTNIFRCNKHHKIEQIQAKVEILQNSGESFLQSVSAGYCQDCNCYFILDADYRRLRTYGVLLCQQLTYESYRSNGDAIMNGEAIKPESLLHQCGYTVSATEALNKQQRQEILRRVVDSGLYSVSGICSHLDWLIDRNRRVATRDMRSAIEKWEEDRNYIATYHSDSQRIVGVKSIKKLL